jgi:hypothetical protein
MPSAATTLSAIDRQIQAFGESAAAVDSEFERGAPIAPAEESRAARDLQALLQIGIFLGRTVVDQAAGVAANIEKNEAKAKSLLPSGEAAFKGVLQAMVNISRHARRLVSAGYQLPSLTEFDEVIVKVRDGICVFQDLALPKEKREENDDIIGSASYAAFSASAADHQPPQSWFEEDFSPLRGKSS